MPSIKFTELEARLGELRRHFLPRKFSPGGKYNKIQIDKVRAYVLLAHAEFEAFLEERSNEAITVAQQSWKKRSKSKSIIISLLTCFSEGEIVDFKKLKRDPRALHTLHESKIKLSMARYKNHLLKNNGIREQNILSLLMPIGIKYSDIDIPWLNTIDSYGKKRGEIAHTSKKVQQAIDPLTELNEVNYLLSGLRDLDDQLERLI